MATDSHEAKIDWSLTTWEGSRRETLKRWAALPLEQIISALEEMQELNAMFSQTDTHSDQSIQEQPSQYKNKDR